MRWTLLLVAGCAPKIDLGSTLEERLTAPIELIEMADEQAMGTYLQVAVHAGSAFDPVGSEGLAALTARSLARGGAGELSSAELEAELYRHGIGLELIVDREWVTLRMACVPEVAERCVELFGDLLTAPGFDPDIVTQQRAKAMYRLTSGAAEDIESLGEEVLQTWLFEAHPYGHPVDGRAGVLGLLDASDLQAFYDRHYVRSAVTAGIAGRYDDALKDAWLAELAQLPTGTDSPLQPPSLVMQKPLQVEGRSLMAIQVDGAATGFHLGHPLPVERDHPDWPALKVAMTAFGAHRQSHGRLFRSLREERGLNYGTYAYIEPFTQRGGSVMAEQGTVRQHPHFSIWVRPVASDNAAFALKLAVHELETLVEQGLSEAEVEATKAYLTRRQPLEAATVDRRLAVAVEASSAELGDPDLVQPLSQLTTAEVNEAIAKHLRPEDLRVVAISGEAEALVARLIEEDATPIVYASIEPSEAQAATDATVAEDDLELTDSHVVTSQGIFR